MRGSTCPKRYIPLYYAWRSLVQRDRPLKLSQPMLSSLRRRARELLGIKATIAVWQALAAFVACAAVSAPACEPFIEEHPGWASASFRPHRNAFERCDVSEPVYRTVVAEWLRARARGHGELASLSLGRAVSFPWLSRHIADAALRIPGWAGRVARARTGERDRLAAEAIRDPDLLRRLAAPFEGSPYVVASVSFEKALFGPADRHSSSEDAGAVMVPFDAQLWLRLAPRN